MKEIDIDKLPPNSFKHVEEPNTFTELFWSLLLVSVFIGFFLFLLALIGMVAFIIINWFVIKTL